MSDGINRMNIIGPTYPVKPVQPSNKERKSDNSKNKEQPDDAGPEKDDEPKSTIDEYI